MGVFRRLFSRMTQTDAERLAEEIREWASEVPGTVRIADAPGRKPVRLAAVVNRITVVPGEVGSLEAVLTDGTGEITAVWTGRRGIPGMRLGTRMVVEGVLAENRGNRRMINPSYEFAAGAP